MPCCAVAYISRFQIGMVGARHGRGVGTVWARRGMCQLAFTVNIWVLLVGTANSQGSHIFKVKFCIVSFLLKKTVALRFSAQYFPIYVLETRPPYDILG